MKHSSKLLIVIIITTTLLFSIIACAHKPHLHPEPTIAPDYPCFDSNDIHEFLPNMNEYNEIIENPITMVTEQPLSTFSLDVNTAGYSNLRRHIVNGYKINKNQVRIEEMVNYFSYDYPEPEEGKPFSVTTAISPSPWNANSHLLTIGLKAEDVEMTDLNNNLVFLLDVSGSMQGPDRLGLIQSAFSLLLDNLNDTDTVSIVTYAGSNRVLLENGSIADKDNILSIIESLSAGGSTAGANGIVTAYQLAEEYFIPGGNNRVILATDGDFNVGVSSQEGLHDLISEKRNSGVYLTVLGFGHGNLMDDKLETLANNGNGNYAYIDTIQEARKVLVEEIGGTLKTVARDVKAQVEFNPAKVFSYRLLGYENKLLTIEDFENPMKDSGEIGAGHSITAVYEIVLLDSEEPSTMDDNYLSVNIRYKDPDINLEDVLEMKVYTDISNVTDEPSEDILFISALIETALLLRDSDYKGTSNYNSIIARLNALNSVATDPYREEFLTLVNILAD